jgi:hypothetical protein
VTCAIQPSETVNPRDVSGMWWAAKCSGTQRAAEKFTSYLESEGIANYLPRQRVRIAKSTKSEIRTRPLFGAYTFIAIKVHPGETSRMVPDVEEWYKINQPPWPLKCQLVAGGKQSDIIETLSALYDTEQAGQLVEAWADFVPGRRVMVKQTHHLRGKWGHVHAHDPSKAQVTIALDGLGLFENVNISPEFLELT